MPATEPQPLPDGVVLGEDGVARCAWAGSAPDYVAYHDTEWGFPSDDDVRLFEKLSLEGFQSGLSWLTILRKREAFRAAFADFDFRVVAGYGPDDVARLLQDAGIVRHRGKIEAVIDNAARAVELVDAEGSLARHIWSFAPDRRGDAADRATRQVQTFSEESTRLSKDLKRRGWRFTGPTTAYAFMQSMGLVNDHLGGCAIHRRVEAALDAFTVPR
ncbi:MAG TPA: DNA-3-methyladenine glycosylase I [Solirubrobacteraceae bacterium]